MRATKRENLNWTSGDVFLLVCGANMGRLACWAAGGTSWSGSGTVDDSETNILVVMASLS